MKRGRKSLGDGKRSHKFNIYTTEEWAIRFCEKAKNENIEPSKLMYYIVDCYLDGTLVSRNSQGVDPDGEDYDEF